MNAQSSGDPFWLTLQRVITQSVAGLPPEDLRARVEHASATGQHGVRVLVHVDQVELHWGGALLAVLPPEAFLDGRTAALSMEMVDGRAPDDASALEGP